MIYDKGSFLNVNFDTFLNVLKSAFLISPDG